MKITATPLAGAYVIDVERLEDERGYFARLWCRDEFARHGIAMDVVQASVSHNVLAGTLRGMHFQRPPSREAKLVRCERGRIFDVIIDLRPELPTFGRHFAIELAGGTHTALYVPPGFAHGFLTLVPDSDVVYMMSDVHRPELADGVRHDDPAFRIRWPMPVRCMMERDRRYPDFDGAGFAGRTGDAI